MGAIEVCWSSGLGESRLIGCSLRLASVFEATCQNLSKSQCDPQSSQPRVALRGTAPASMDAGTAFVAQRELTGSRAPVRKARSALVAVRTGDVSARQDRGGL